jgi:hypothetical protein
MCSNFLTTNRLSFTTVIYKKNLWPSHIQISKHVANCLKNNWMPVLYKFHRANTWSINSRLASTCSNRSAQTLIHASCCHTVRFWGPSWQNFSHPQLFIQYWMISQFMFSSSAITFTVNLQLDQSSSFTCAVLYSIHVVDGHLLQCVTSTRVLASENILC